MPPHLRRWSGVATGVAFAGLAANVDGVQAQEIAYTGSLYVAHNAYPDDTGRATSVYVFNGVDVTIGPLRTSVSVPFVSRRSIFSDAAVDPVTDARSDVAETTSGLADPLIRLDLRVFDNSEQDVQLGVTGSVKLPLVSADGDLGTGETDVGIGGFAFAARGPTSFFGDVEFWKYGDPEGVDFQDAWSYSVGVGRVLGTGRWTAMAAIGGFSSGADGQAGPFQLNLTMLALAGRRQSVAITMGLGVNDASRGFSIGTSWRIAR